MNMMRGEGGGSSSPTERGWERDPKGHRGLPGLGPYSGLNCSAGVTVYTGTKANKALNQSFSKGEGI